MISFTFANSYSIANVERIAFFTLSYSYRITIQVIITTRIKLYNTHIEIHIQTLTG